MKNVSFSKISKHSTPDESPGFLLWRISTRWRKSIEGVLKAFELTHPQFVLLASIGWLTKDQESISQRQIGDHTEIDPNTISQILRGLEKKGLVVRTVGDDVRSKSPILTKKGVALLENALPAVEAADQRFFEEVDKDLARLAHL